MCGSPSWCRIVVAVDALPALVQLGGAGAGAHRFCRNVACARVGESVRSSKPSKPQTAARCQAKQAARNLPPSDGLPDTRLLDFAPKIDLGDRTLPRA